MFYFVYGYFIDGQPFYIGKGSSDRAYRHRAHLVNCWNAAHHSYGHTFYRKLRKMITNKIDFEIKILRAGLTESEAFDLEINLIKEHGRRDNGTGCLCNLTDGGEGTAGGLGRLGVPQSIDTIIKMSRKRTPAEKLAIQISHRVLGQPLESFNLKTGAIIKRYETVHDVGRDGYNVGNVRSYCKGRKNYAYGLGWRFV